MPGRLMAAVEANLGELYDPEAGRMAVAFTEALEGLVAERNAQLDAIVARLDGRLDDIEERVAALQAADALCEGMVAASLAEVRCLVRDLRPEGGQLLPE